MKVWEGKKFFHMLAIFLIFFFFFFLNIFKNKNTMVASKMGLLRRTANWNLWYMNVDLDLDFGCSLLFLFYVYGWEMWYLSNFCVFNRFGYRARWTSAYVSSLHCYILSSCEQTPTGIFSIIGVWVKWIVGATGVLFWFPGGKRNWDFTLPL